MIWLLLVIVGILATVLYIQSGQRRLLDSWLDNPQHQTPDGIGSWRDTFARLHQLTKRERNHQRALESSRDRFRLAVETLPDGVILIDSSGHIEWLNVTAAKLLDLDATRDLGTLIEHLIRQTVFIDYFKHYRLGRVLDPLILQRNGDAPLVSLSIQLLPLMEGGTLLLCRDISDITRTEKIRRDFIANVSHELRTPLTVISGFLEQLTGEDPPIGDTAHNFMVLMDEQAKRMNRLVADLLTLSRLENATEPPKEETIDVPALIQTLLAETKALSNGRHTIESGLVASLKVTGSGDELRSAFSNLLSNAVRYTPAGGCITPSWQEKDGVLVFSVTDTGIGVPAEHLARLTERFYRVDKGRSTSTGGTGLGLAIVKHVLARHQGILKIFSNPGQGSTFSACLPVARKINP